MRNEKRETPPRKTEAFNFVLLNMNCALSPHALARTVDIVRRGYSSRALYVRAGIEVGYVPSVAGGFDCAEADSVLAYSDGGGVGIVQLDCYRRAG